MNGLASVVLLIAAGLTILQGLFFVVGGYALQRKRRGDRSVIQFALAKACLCFAEATVFVCLSITGGSSEWTIPLAFVVFVGGNWGLSRLARRTIIVGKDAGGVGSGASLGQ